MRRKCRDSNRACSNRLRRNAAVRSHLQGRKSGSRGRMDSFPKRMKAAVAIIPARWRSTRFPGKPLHLIAGKALLHRVWDRTRRAKTLDQVIIATDDMRIAEEAFLWGAEVALTSSKHSS